MSLERYIISGHKQIMLGKWEDFDIEIDIPEGFKPETVLMNAPSFNFVLFTSKFSELNENPWLNGAATGVGVTRAIFQSTGEDARAHGFDGTLCGQCLRLMRLFPFEEIKPGKFVVKCRYSGLTVPPFQSGTPYIFVITLHGPLTAK